LSEARGHIASHARQGARTVAAIAIDAIAIDAFFRRHALEPVVLFAHAIAIANATAYRTAIAPRHIRIRWSTGRAAEIIGAVACIDRQISRIDLGYGLARAITDNDFAILVFLRAGHERTCGRVIESANAVTITCSRLANIVRSGAIGCFAAQGTLV